MVVETLTPLDGSRKCYHLIGGVLVEKTVAEALPTVSANKDGIASVLANASTKLEKLAAERQSLQTKYKIQFVSEQEAMRIQQEQQRRAAGGSA